MRHRIREQSYVDPELLKQVRAYEAAMGCTHSAFTTRDTTAPVAALPNEFRLAVVSPLPLSCLPRLPRARCLPPAGARRRAVSGQASAPSPSNQIRPAPRWTSTASHPV